MAAPRPLPTVPEALQLLAEVEIVRECDSYSGIRGALLRALDRLAGMASGDNLAEEAAPLLDLLAEVARAEKVAIANGAEDEAAIEALGERAAQLCWRSWVAEMLAQNTEHQLSLLGHCRPPYGTGEPFKLAHREAVIVVAAHLLGLEVRRERPLMDVLSGMDPAVFLGSFLGAFVASKHAASLARSVVRSAPSMAPQGGV